MPEKISQKMNTSDRIREREAAAMKFSKQVELRLRFCEAIAEKKDIPLADAFDKYSDMLRRVGDVNETDVPDVVNEWRKRIAGVAELPSHSERLNKLVQLYIESDMPNIEHGDEPYYPFLYSYDEFSKTISPHFGTLSITDDRGDGPGILSHQRLEEMRGKLRAMFTEIKRDHPDAEYVRGRSWLYGLEAYRRLYPQEYGESRTLRTIGYNGGARWGQFLNAKGELNTERATQFLENLNNLDPENPAGVFPMQTYEVRAPIAAFYREYGIE